MLSYQPKRIAWQLTVTAAALACAVIFVWLWRPFFSMPEEDDPLAMAYGVIPFLWTVAAFAVILLAFLIGLVLRPELSLACASAVLAGFALFLVWRLSPMAQFAVPPPHILAVLAGSLLPPVALGWLLGYAARVKRSAVARTN